MKKGIYSAILAATLTISVFALPIINSESSPDQDDPDAIGRSSARITNENDNKTKPTEDNTPKNDETVTFIITVNGDSLVDTVLKSGNKYSNVTDLLKSNDGRSYVDTIKKNQAVVKASIQLILTVVIHIILLLTDSVSLRLTVRLKNSGMSAVLPL